MAITNPVTETKTHIGRAKALLKKNEVVKCMAELVGAIRLHIANPSKFIGPERFEIMYSLDELVSSLNVVPQLQKFIESPLGYKKGKEREALVQLSTILKNILEDMQREHEEEEKVDPDEEERKRQLLLLNKMQQYLNGGDMMRAGAALRKLLEENEGNSEVYMDIAERYYAVKMFPQVVEYTNMAIKQNPKEMRAYKLQVNAYRYQKDYESAQNVYKQTLQVFGQHPNIYLNLMKLYNEWGKGELAEKCAQAVVKLGPDTPEAAEARGYLESVQPAAQ